MFSFKSDLGTEGEREPHVMIITAYSKLIFLVYLLIQTGSLTGNIDTEINSSYMYIVQSYQRQIDV